MEMLSRGRATTRPVARSDSTDGNARRSACVARASARLAYARWITYARSLVHDALTATRPTMPRTVIGAGESESVLVAADSVVHKRGGRRHLFPSRPRRSPSLPIRSPLSRSSSPSLSRSYGQPIAAGKLKRARSRPIASDVPACYPVRVYIKAAGLSAIRPHTLDHAAQSPFGRLRPSSASFFSWPRFSSSSSATRASLPSVRAKDVTPGYNPLPLDLLFLYAERSYTMQLLTELNYEINIKRPSETEIAILDYLDNYVNIYKIRNIVERLAFRIFLECLLLNEYYFR